MLTPVPKPFVAVLGPRIAAAADRCRVLAAVAEHRERAHRADAQRRLDVAAQVDARTHGGAR